MGLRKEQRHASMLLAGGLLIVISTQTALVAMQRDQKAGQPIAPTSRRPGFESIPHILLDGANVHVIQGGLYLCNESSAADPRRYDREQANKDIDAGKYPPYQLK